MCVAENALCDQEQSDFVCVADADAVLGAGGDQKFPGLGAHVLKDDVAILGHLSRAELPLCDCLQQMGSRLCLVLSAKPRSEGTQVPGASHEHSFLQVQT